MTILGIILLIIGALFIVQAIRSWGPTNKERGAAAVWAGVGIVLVILSGVFGVLNQSVT